MQEAKLYLVQFAEDKPSEFFKHTPNEVVYTRYDSDKRELYITNFLGRGDMVNKNNVCITNESISKFENRWIGALHVILDSGKHIPYYAPKNIAMSGLEKELFFKAQALPHSIGQYVDSFHITDEIGIHNLYGTLLTKNPIAIQNYVEKKYPRFTSSSLLVNQRDSQNRITDWTPIDNTSVNKPAYPMTISEIVDSCSCISGNRGGSSCISKLRQSTNEKKKVAITVAQSSIYHGVECIEKGFENNKIYFESDNAHYQFLAQSSIMGESEGSTGTNANATNTTGSEGQNTQNNANNAEGSQQQNNQNQTQNLGQVLLNKKDNPANADAMSRFTFESNEKPEGQEGGEGQGKPEGGNPEGDQNSAEYWKAKALAAETGLKELTSKTKDYDNMVAIVKANERQKIVSAKINELAKGKFSEERRNQLINHFSGEGFNSITDDKQLVKLIEKEFEVMIAPQIKQSGETVDEISSKFLAKSQVEQSGEEERKPNKRFIDVTKTMEYLP